MQSGILWVISGLFVVSIGSYMVWHGTQVYSAYRSELSQNKLIHQFKVILTDKENRKLTGFTGVQVLDDKIVDSNKGYLRIKILTDYLNSSFARPVTIKNINDEFQPITVICDSDSERGPGIFVILPTPKARTVFYLTDFLKFEGFAKIRYVEDFIFEVFYNDFSFYFVTTSGAVKLEPLPNGTNTLST